MSISGPYVIGIDLGGTKIATVLTGGDLSVIQRLVITTRPEEGSRAVLDRIVDSAMQVASCLPRGIQDVDAVTIGSPGPVDPTGEVVLDAPNLGWKCVPAARIVGEALGRTVFLENDANLAALAENRLGAGRGTSHMIYITVSTGIGSGLILGGQLYRGFSGSAGELGHVTMVKDGPLCGCGNRGCLEAVASGTAIGRRGQEVACRPTGEGILRAGGGDASRVDASVVAAAARAGDRAALAILHDAFEYLGIAVANVLNLLNLQMVVVGGGVSRTGDILFDTVRATVSLRAFAYAARDVAIVPAALGEDVGALGAACYALDKARK
ncbi:MAG: ROK family protein [Firmicutes bacterium]|nr:ROK family protein [Bacillota bacterium]